MDELSAQEKLLNQLYDSLDEEQRHVVSWRPDDGNLRVVSAAGSGKTLTLVCLAAELVTKRLITPDRLMLVTFSRKAGDELKTRLAKIVPPYLLSGIKVGTFHALALRALGPLDAKLWSLDRGMEMDAGTRAPGVPSTYELWRSIVSYGTVPGTKAESLRLPESPSYFVSKIDLWRSQGHEKFDTVPPEPGWTHGERETYRKVWKMYNEAKKALKAWDFGDLLAGWKTALEEGKISPPEGMIVLVDEAQDNNIVQLKIAQLLAKNDGRICLFGDLRQTVHTWRGSYPELFEKSPQTLNAQTREISTNYRSSAPIVRLANYITKGQPWNVGSPSKAHKGEDYGAIEVMPGAFGPDEEAENVATRIQQEIESGASAGDFAVLCRTNAGRALFEGALSRKGIPVVVIGGSSVFRIREAEVIMAYAALSKFDAVPSLERVLNQPKRFLPNSFVGDVHEEMKTARDLPSAIRTAARMAGLKPGSKRGAQELAEFIEDLRSLEWRSVPNAIEKLLKRDLTREAENADEDRQSLISSICMMASRFEGPVEFISFAQKCLDGTVSMLDGTPPSQCVTLSTCHSVKGLQYDNVFISSNRTMFPHKKAKDQDEELRLFYVAVTRAAKKVTFCWNRIEGLTNYLPSTEVLRQIREGKEPEG